jgi:hypothetical protein
MSSDKTTSGIRKCTGCPWPAGSKLEKAGPELNNFIKSIVALAPRVFAANASAGETYPVAGVGTGGVSFGIAIIATTVGVVDCVCICFFQWKCGCGVVQCHGSTYQLCGRNQFIHYCGELTACVFGNHCNNCK